MPPPTTANSEAVCVFYATTYATKIFLGMNYIFSKNSEPPITPGFIKVFAFLKSATTKPVISHDERVFYATAFKEQSNFFHPLSKA